MQKVTLRMNEQEKYDLIKNLVTKNGNKRVVSLKLKCSLRTINRLIIRFKSKGKAGFIHGNRGSKSKAKNQEIKQAVVNYYQQHQYNESNFTHFNELIKDNHNIDVSYTFIYQTLSKAGILSPKCQRITKRRKLKTEREQANMHNHKEQILSPVSRAIPNSLAHPRKPRAKYFGELIQMDASDHLWIAQEKWHLHIAVDDSTSKIVGGSFAKEETLAGYYQVLSQVLTNYGIPYAIKTDNRMVFTNNKEKNPSQKNEKDSHTQFGYACQQLGIELTTTSIPQAKGRVERSFGTLQSRLITELKIANVKTIEEANEFLKTYINKYNNSNLVLRTNLNTSVFEQEINQETINTKLAILSSRKIDNGCGIQFKNKYYQPYKDNQLVTFRSKTKCLVIECLDKNLLVSIEDKIYELRELDQHKKLSSNFDLTIVKNPKTKNQYTPPMSHPWKYESWKKYINSPKYKNKNSTNVF